MPGRTVVEMMFIIFLLSSVRLSAKRVALERRGLSSQQASRQSGREETSGFDKPLDVLYIYYMSKSPYVISILVIARITSCYVTTGRVEALDFSNVSPDHDQIQFWRH